MNAKGCSEWSLYIAITVGNSSLKLQREWWCASDSFIRSLIDLGCVYTLYAYSVPQAFIWSSTFYPTVYFWTLRTVNPSHLHLLQPLVLCKAMLFKQPVFSYTKQCTSTVIGHFVCSLKLCRCSRFPATTTVYNSTFLVTFYVHSLYWLCNIHFILCIFFIFCFIVVFNLYLL